VSETDRDFDAWAIVEAMGFKKYAGHVTTQELAGASFIRVDVPECKSADVVVPAYSKLIGAASIYMITPTDEVTARKAARVLARQESPLPVYIPPEPKQLTRPLTEEPIDEEWDGALDPIAEQLQQDAIDEQLDADARAAEAAIERGG
jgi:hypothetical protein